ncbi:MAG: cyanophycin synthetase [Myxococcota bacterium]
MIEAIQDSPGYAPVGSPAEYRAMVARLFGLSRAGMKLGLAPTARLFAGLGHPERAFRAVHIAGSNGKGSTTAFLATVLSMSGRQVGMYTSPHLVSMTERVQFLRRGRAWPVEQSTMVQAVDRVEAVAPGFEGVSFFEVITAAGMWVFAEAQIDIAVIEAGLGARLDSTRLVPAEVSILTDLSLEHTSILGESIEEIAKEEGAVVRPGRPLVMADGPSPAMDVVDGMARDVAAPVYRLGRDFAVQRAEDGRFEFELADRKIGPVQLSLLGAHQSRNAALAAQAAVLTDPNISDDDIVTGLSVAFWPGRMEVVRRPQQPPVLLDGAQNAHAAATLASALKMHQDRFQGPYHFVFGVMSDKDARSMIADIAPLAATITFTRPNSTRARAPEELALLVPPGPSARIEPVIENALSGASAAAAADGGWVVVCGSLYLIGDVRALLGLD